MNTALATKECDQLQVVYRDIKQLIPYARNARTHSDQQVVQIAASIHEFGFVNPILLDTDNGIIAGHGRVQAADLLKMKKVPTIVLPHLSDAQKRAFIIADNKLALNAGWDLEMLALELQDLNTGDIDLLLTGFDSNELDDLLTWKPNDEGFTDPDDVPDVPESPVSILGDLWLLDKHRLICGDATNVDVLEQLMDGEQAGMVWTDPPYNVAYGGKAEMLDKYEKGHRNTQRILNDDMDDASFRKFLRAFYRAAWSVLADGGAIYVAHAETERANFTNEFLAAGFKLSGVIIWRKNNLVLGRSDYQWIHEPILYGWKPSAKHRWYGGRKKTTVEQLGPASPFVKRADGRWEIHLGVSVFIVDGQAEVEELLTSVIDVDKPRCNDLHPTMKPVALIERMLKNSAIPGDIILDVFGGSGSTLIAVERCRMRGHLSELDPKYVDVIIKRWQNFTGKTAVLESDGRTFDEVRACRGKAQVS